MTHSLARRAHGATHVLHSLICFAPETGQLTGAGLGPRPSSLTPAAMTRAVLAAGALPRQGVLAAC
ncbi:MAG: hypothetical protein ACLP70_19840 [Streptosporangiaceae bacterium]